MQPATPVAARQGDEADAEEHGAGARRWNGIIVSLDRDVLPR